MYISREDIDTKVNNRTQSILHAAEACNPKTSTVHTKHEFSWKTWIADKHFVSVIGDTGISARNPVKLVSWLIKRQGLRQDKSSL